MRVVWALRSLLFVLWMAATVIPWGTMMLVLSIFWRGEKLYWPTMRWLRMAIWGARVICGVNYRVHGMDHLPTAGRQAFGRAAGVEAPKHLGDLRLSHADAAPAGLCVQARTAVCALLRLGDGPAGHDPHRPQQARRGLEQGGGAGQAAGGRGHLGDHVPGRHAHAARPPGHYKNGASRLAIATGVPIVPIAASSAKCWPRKSFLLRPGVIDVSIGRPIDSTGRQPDELMREVEAWIEAEMRRLDPAAYPAAASAVQSP